jgi:hypothetical protein
MISYDCTIVVEKGEIVSFKANKSLYGGPGFQVSLGFADEIQLLDEIEKAIEKRS